METRCEIQTWNIANRLCREAGAVVFCWRRSVYLTRGESIDFIQMFED